MKNKWLTVIQLLFDPSQRVGTRDGENRVETAGRHLVDGFLQMIKADERRRTLNQSDHVDF